MALTRVSRHIIDDPFNPTAVSATDVTTTNINASGIGTVGTLRVTGDLTVEGTTTTLDSILTEVDRLEVSANSTVAAGIITQTGSGDIFQLYDGSTKVVDFNQYGNLSITSTNPVFKSKHSTGNVTTTLFSNSTSGVFQTNSGHDLVLGTGGVEKVRITSNGRIGINTTPGTLLELRGQSSKEADVTFNRQPVQSTNDGVIGQLLFENSTDSVAQISVKRESAADDAYIQFATQATGGGLTERLRITSDGKVRVPDNGKFVVGDGDDLQIFHGNNLSYVANYTGELLILNHTNDSDISIHSDNGSGGTAAYFRADGSTGDAILYHYGTQKLATKSTGIQVTGQIDIGTTSIYGTGDISMGDSDQLRLGGGDDLRIYHDGSINRIRSDVLTVIEKNDSEDMASFMPDGAVVLFHNGNQRFETTNTGASVTGNLNISGHTYLNDDREIVIGAGQDLKLYHDSATGDSFIKETGSGNLKLVTSTFRVRNAADTEHIIWANQDAEVRLYHNNEKKLETTTTGAKVTGALEVTQEYPSIRPTLDLNFAATKTLDRRITFTRDSIGTYTDDMGIVKYASNNVPRFDHDPATGESLGLLVEESRTNLFTYSEAFNTNWTNIRSSDSGTTATADPEGNTTGAAYKLVANTDNNTHRLDKTGLSMSTSTTYTMSVWAKAAEYTGVSLTIADSSNASHGIYFDLSNGTFTNGGNAHSGSMIAYPNGWYRCIATYTTPASITWQQCLIGVLQNGTTKSYAGNNSSGIYIWGAQLEEDAFATSYIYTPGSTVTRTADLPYIEGSNFSDFYDPAGSGGTFFVEFGGSNTSGTVLSLGPDSGHTQTTGFGNSGYTQGIVSSNYNTYNTYGGTGAADAGWNTTGTNKFAFTITSSQVKLCGNGKAVKTGSGSTPIFTNFTKLTFGGNISWDKTYTGQKKSHMRSIKYYRSLLSDSQLQGLTAQ